MEPTDITIEILKGIQRPIVGLREDMGEVKARLGQVEKNTAVTVDVLRVVVERLDEQGRLGERVDDLERRVEALEQRPGQ